MRLVNNLLTASSSQRPQGAGKIGRRGRPRQRYSVARIGELDGFRKKRNVSSYDVAGSVSDKEADEVLKLATSLRLDVEKWIRATRPELFEPTA